MRKNILLPKLTAKECVGTASVKAALDAGGWGPESDDVVLFDVAGSASGYKVVKTQYGESVRFLGEFLAIPRIGPSSGEKLRSAGLFLPGVGQDLVYAQLQNLEEGSVQFSFRVYAQYSEKSRERYVYVIESLTEPSADDPLEAQMTAALKNAEPLPELPAPEKKPAKKK